MKQKGFTLIELVIVIVILGILSVTAAVKFIDLQRDARISALKGLKGEMLGAANQLHPKTILAGMATQASGAITIEGDTIQIVYGYPKADAAKAWNSLMNQTFIDSQYNDTTPSDWYFHNDTSKPFITFMHKSKKYSKDNCYIKYSEAINVNTPPVFEFVNTGC
ncbi:type II secretion system protein [Aliivibrio sp. S4TY2]|uniref:type II secretion system protein n=1 Tax=unclassified Aliivibrio TaxID=2645654 RepID=UPI002377D98A|nr:MULTISPECIES: type II secretion system protein [unclassified Aliivibrio]MDD9157516.1 type II secretion system protein [Aliivibrio sp. S4TY2]MDD9161290.1 type II secretion system protein [Aliivibrio sp. S4TY1]MDD9165320.1 type II secretion system protein [Aliivibrio sp. S4MY2]MDD9169425.1 type II secretion system protein [Aliivibrio sp. S4MY4]MDD9186418.1 type II secretion system protein [Aliivibrio sp. S4MY3]